SYLSQQGIVKGPKSSKETIDGNRDIYLKGEVAYMQQLAPKYFPLPYKGISEQDVLASLHLQKTDLLAGHNPMPVNTGNSFMMIPVKDEATLKAIHPDLNAIHQISEALDLIGYYPFTLETQVRGRDAATRMFAPYYGIPEEAATGMAAGPLACYLFDQININKETLILEQGRLMPTPSPSEILVELKLEDGSIKSLLAGGRAKVTRSIEIELD
ncbi:MAG TPA: PhzF family phenazine biosynthesis isomerase, partial [Anaerolineales bacterium]|nr:PhzF family phenazine biosynthesis isomerase [Anaerolineales bacterium]